ncbi:MAG: hypothetical protein ACRBB0_20870 [Pelagimonas sp.]|uniref:hypothetical protein n=1 Tax=Pelagimonas sp. TaxID=2073170 RepID=UPI003D6B7FFB
MKRFLTPSYVAPMFRLRLAMIMAFIGVCIGGGFIMFDTELLSSRGSVQSFIPLWSYFSAIGLGAFVAGGLLAHLFGRPGGLGVILSLVGGVLASVIAAMIAGLITVPSDLDLPILNLILVVVLTPLNLTWVAMIFGLHFYSAKVRSAMI